MLAELLILFVLFEQKCTIYKIRKIIKKYFFLFAGASMGTIHPALQKLHTAKYVSVQKSMSKGGQKSSIYAVTPQGKKYFEKLMLEDLPQNPSLSAQIVKIKSLLLPRFKKESRLEVIAILKNYYENKLPDFENYLENCENPDFQHINKDYVKRCMDEIKDELNWLKFQALI